MKSYCNIDLDELAASGLLPVPRIAVLRHKVNELIQPCYTRYGVVIDSAKTLKLPDGSFKIYPIADHDPGWKFIEKEALNFSLSEGEAQLINDVVDGVFERKEDEKRFAEAVKVPADQWSDWVYYQDEYFDSVQAFINEMHNDERPLPGYVWGIGWHAVINGKKVEDIVEDDLIQRGWEDMDTLDLHGVRELQDALNAFVDKNQTVQACHPDYSKAIVLSVLQQ